MIHPGPAARYAVHQAIDRRRPSLRRWSGQSHEGAAPILLPSPLWGGVGGGGRGVEKGCAPWHVPPPRPSPTRGEGEEPTAPHAISLTRWWREGRESAGRKRRKSTCSPI